MERLSFRDRIPAAAALRERKLSDYDVVRIARDIAKELAEPHAHGIVDEADDLSALGALLYHALGGASPSDAAASFYSLRPDLPEAISKIIARCDTHSFTAQELAAALEHVLPRLSREALPVTPTVIDCDCAANGPEAVAALKQRD